MKKVVSNVNYLSMRFKSPCYINHLKMKIGLHFNKSLTHLVMYKEGVSQIVLNNTDVVLPVIGLSYEFTTLGDTNSVERKSYIISELW